MKKQFIKDFKVNEKVDSYFVLRKKNIKLTKHDKPYLEMSFSDKSGKIEARLWDNAEKFAEGIETGDVVKVKGFVDKFKEEKQLKIDSIEKLDSGDIEYEDLVRVAENRDKIFEDVKGVLDTIKNPRIKGLVGEFIQDVPLMGALKEGVGGKSWHNAYIGGLLEHTYEVMYVADKMCVLYPEADRDITIFGAFIHDIGKVYELDPKKMEYTIEGGLVGHIAIGFKILNEKMTLIKDFPKELGMRLEHIILSHHGEYEQQSPVLPKTLEATIVYQVDELVSQANAVKELTLQQAEEGKVWSDFVFIKGRKYYIKDAQEEEWSHDKTEDASKGKNKDLFD